MDNNENQVDQMDATIELPIVGQEDSKIEVSRRGFLGAGAVAAGAGAIPMTAAMFAASAKSQASEIVANAEKRGNAVVDEAKASATSEKERIVSSAQAEVEQDVHSAREQLRTQVSSIAVAAASKIVGKEIDETAHAALIEDLVKQLKAG